MPVKNMSDYALLNHFNLACHRTLHSTEQDTPLEHEHLFYELVVVCSGSGVNRTGGRDCKISSGNVFLIPPHRKHWYTKYNNLEIFNLVFNKSFFRYFLPDLMALPGYQLLFNVDMRQLAEHAEDGIRIDDEAFPEIVSILNEMDKLNYNGEPGDKCIILADFIRVMLLIARHSHWAGGGNKHEHIGNLTEVLSKLEARCGENWDLSGMAKLAKMGVSSFRQEFRKLTGISPIQYLLKLRLARAAFLMESTDAPIEQLIFECGFTDRSYFSRQFLKQYGMRPSHYRAGFPDRLREEHKDKPF